MSLPEALDISRLLEPIPGDSATGVDLREDFSPESLYQEVKFACTKARTAERKLTEGSDTAPPDWSPVLELVPKALAEQSKDLEIATWYVEALVREHGFAGARDGFRLLKELAERYWDGIYPLPDEDDGVRVRVEALEALNGRDGRDGLLIGPLNEIPLTDGRSEAPLGRTHFIQAEALESITDPDKRSERLAAGGISMEAFERAVIASDEQFSLDLAETISEALEAYRELVALLEEKCRADEAGDGFQIPSSLVEGTLESCREVLAEFAAGVGGEAPAESESEEAPSATNGAGAARSAPPAAGRLQSREEAFQTLLRVAQFFKETEPHSPVSYALERVVKWGRMPLPQLLAEIISEEGSRDDVFHLVGIPKPPEPED